jgi:hypothetical protein
MSGRQKRKRGTLKVERVRVRMGNGGGRGGVGGFEVASGMGYDSIH